MKNFYITFNDNDLLAGHIVRVEAKDKSKVYTIASKQFGEKWKNCFTEKEFTQDKNKILKDLILIDGGIHTVEENLFQITQIISELKELSEINVTYIHDSYNSVRKYGLNISVENSGTFQAYNFWTIEDTLIFIKGFKTGFNFKL